MSYERSLPMAMLPNDSHPGPGCSCEHCLRAYPPAPEGNAMKADPELVDELNRLAEVYGLNELELAMKAVVDQAKERSCSSDRPTAAWNE